MPHKDHFKIVFILDNHGAKSIVDWVLLCWLRMHRTQKWNMFPLFLHQELLMQIDKWIGICNKSSWSESVFCVHVGKAWYPWHILHCIYRKKNLSTSASILASKYLEPLKKKLAIQKSFLVKVIIILLKNN